MYKEEWKKKWNMSYKIVQWNMNHCWGAHYLLQQFMVEENIAIAAIMEPVCVPNDSNWVCSKDRKTAIFWRPKCLKTQCKLLIQEEEFIAISFYDVVIIACYLSPKYKVEEVVKVLDKMEAEMEKIGGRNLILCGDFNAHSRLWGARITSCKGGKLERWAESNNLILINDGKTPTCVRPQGESVIDLTWVSACMMERVIEWKVEEEKVSLSDHSYITFRVVNTRENRNETGIRKKNKYPRWKIKAMNEEVYKEAIEWKCETYKMTEDIREKENGAEWLQEIVTEAADLSTPRVKGIPNKKKVHWWNEDIAQKRKQCIRSRRKWTKARRGRNKKRNVNPDEEAESLERLEKEYRERKKELVKEIIKAKEESWKTLIKEIDGDPWGIPYKLVMNRLRNNTLGLNETLEEEKLNRLICKLFPREMRKEEKEKEITIRDWKEEWNISVVEVHEVLRKKVVKNTAPGPDGLVQKMWKRMPEKLLEIIAEIFTRYMKKGEFPERWKRAKLVLIPKEGKFDQELPKARPICLINDIGKGFERILVNRILKWLEDKEGLIGRNQFGFRKNKSTIDALMKVKETVEEVIKEGRVIIAISLDVENAFNSIPWGKIRLMLRRKRFPRYLRRILHSYFTERRIEYITKEGTVKMMEVEKGVPQGSVLGPLLWILVYDKVLKTSKEEGCEIVGYADDTIILSEADTYDEAKTKACIQTDRVIKEIRQLGLQVAIEKTEAVVFYGKKGKRPPKEDRIQIDREQITIGRKMKYLGVILDSNLKFEEHFRYLEGKIAKIKRALGKLMPNLRGPQENKRKLYSNIIQSVVMYGVPIWGDSFIKNTTIQRPLMRTQKYMATRIIAGYKTISYEIATLLARTPPWVLVVEKYKGIYLKRREAKREDRWDRKEKEKIRQEEEEKLNRKWKRRIRRDDLPGIQLRKAIDSCFTEWINRNEGGINYHLTQILTGHGCFNAYLHRIQKLESGICTNCEGEGKIDTVEHTLEECEAWTRQREELKEVLKCRINLKNIMEALCKGKEKWDAVNKFAQEVMREKEENEREEKRRKANANAR